MPATGVDPRGNTGVLQLHRSSVGRLSGTNAMMQVRPELSWVFDNADYHAIVLGRRKARLPSRFPCVQVLLII